MDFSGSTFLLPWISDRIPEPKAENLWGCWRAHILPCIVLRRQLIRELGKKSRIIQHYVLCKQSDALISAEADSIKVRRENRCWIPHVTLQPCIPHSWGSIIQVYTLHKCRVLFVWNAVFEGSFTQNLSRIGFTFLSLLTRTG